MKLRLGQKVQLLSTGEVGVVVWLWNDDGIEDAYIAFFGDQFPEGVPTNKPYVLRYYATSLKPLE